LTRSLRSQYPTNLDKNERKASRYGAWDFFKEDSNRPNGILTNDLKQKIDQSFGNTVEVPVLDREDVTIQNVRSCTIADDDSTSALVQLNFATFSFGFSMYAADYKQNDIKYQADYDQKLRKYLLKLASLFDENSIATLEADKNSYAGAGALAAFYPVVGDSLQVPWAEKENFYNNLESIKEVQDFYDKTHIIHNPNHSPLVRRLDNQGSNNGVNENFQLEPYSWYKTNRIANAVGVNSTLYAVTEGNVGVYWRLDPDAMNRERLGDAEWDVVQMPLVEIPMGSYYTRDCSDRSSVLPGGSRTVRETFEFSADLCWFSAYNSDEANQYGPIQKAEIMAEL
ncbi:MAG: hypothetical protein WD512_20230, partial [Candidatus Paceibacterota bacterium]